MPANGGLLNSGSSRLSGELDAAAGRQVGWTTRSTGSSALGAAPRRAPRPTLDFPDFAPPPAAPRSARRARPCRAVPAATRYSPPRVAASRPGRDSSSVAIRPRAVRLTRFRRVLGRAPGERDRPVASPFRPVAPGAFGPLLPSFRGRYHALRSPVTLKSVQFLRPSARNRPSRALMVVLGGGWRLVQLELATPIVRQGPGPVRLARLRWPGRVPVARAEGRVNRLPPSAQLAPLRPFRCCGVGHQFTVSSGFSGLDTRGYMRA